MQRAFARTRAIHARLLELDQRLLHAPMRPLHGHPDHLQQQVSQLDELLSLETDALQPSLTAFLDEQFAALTEIDATLTDTERDACRRHHRALVQPFFLGSQFIRRAVDKPLGYAGDFEIVEMLFDNAPGGATPLARLLSRYVLELGLCRGHRSRLPWVHHYLWQLLEAGHRPSVLSFACGPERVLREFVATGGLCDITLVDFDPRALSFSQKRLAEVIQQRRVDVHVRGLELSAYRVVRDARAVEALRQAGPPAGYDLITVLGLFDYLEAGVAERLAELLSGLLRPGGRFLATNLNAASRWRSCMEYVAEWSVIHRDMREFCELMLGRPARLELVELTMDATNTNIFFAGERPGLT